MTPREEERLNRVITEEQASFARDRKAWVEGNLELGARLTRSEAGLKHAARLLGDALERAERWEAIARQLAEALRIEISGIIPSELTRAALSVYRDAIKEDGS